MRQHDWVQIRHDHKYKFIQIGYDYRIHVEGTDFGNVGRDNPAFLNIQEIIERFTNNIIDSMVHTQGAHCMHHKVFDNITETDLDLAWNKLYDHKLEIDVKHPSLEQLAPHIRQRIQCVSLYEKVSNDTQRLVVDPILHTINNIFWRHIAISICSSLRAIRLNPPLPTNLLETSWNKL